MPPFLKQPPHFNNPFLFTLGEPYQDNTKKNLHEIKQKENNVHVSVSLDEEPED